MSGNRGRGPEPTLKDPIYLSVRVERQQVDYLTAYASREGISRNEAARRAIEALRERERGMGSAGAYPASVATCNGSAVCAARRSGTSLKRSGQDSNLR